MKYSTFFYVLMSPEGEKKENILLIKENFKGLKCMARKENCGLTLEKMLPATPSSLFFLINSLPQVTYLLHRWRLLYFSVLVLSNFDRRFLFVYVFVISKTCSWLLEKRSFLDTAVNVFMMFQEFIFFHTKAMM